MKAGLAKKDPVGERKFGRKKFTKSEATPPAAKLDASPSVLHEGKHSHHVRTECECCKKSGPDVEYYEHKNRSLNVRWLCVKCADSYNIPDACRLTEQSQFAKNGRFLREYGATKVF